MARYKHSDSEDGRGLFLSVNLKEQLLPGTFEYTLNDLINNRIDISNFDRNYKNDQTGASATPPNALIKLILYGYSKGRRSSRGIGELNGNNIQDKALAGCMEIRWTTTADFISGSHEKFREVFIKVSACYNGLGLAGGERFAIDGCRPTRQ
jgi:transposase